jgi:heptaprenyl diphosphate synthase
MIPKPLPFMRIGLANLPLMLAVDILPFPSYMLLGAIKICGQALVTGTLFSYVFLFSLTGTGLSALAMFALRRALGPRRISFIGVGAAGALLSNLSQLALAWFFVFRESVRYIIPPFLAAGLITGVVLGVFLEYFTARSRWYAALRGG